MKKIKTSLCLLALSVSTAHAGGFENARLDTSFMYDEGNLVSFGSVRKDFTVNGSAFGTTKSLIGDRSASNLSAKYQVNDKLALGLTAYDSGAIHINYQGAGGSVTFPGTSHFWSKSQSDIRFDSIMSNYRFRDSFSAGGVKRNDNLKYQNADIFKIANPSFRYPRSAQIAILFLLLAVAFEKPDIALSRVSCASRKTKFAMHATNWITSSSPVIN